MTRGTQIRGSRQYEAIGRWPRTKRRLGLVAAGLGLAAVAAVPSVQAHSSERTIQPGAPVYPGHTPLGPWSPCTLNFVFRDAQNTYIGTAARCTVAVGERVTMDDREFGTVVFRAFSGTEEAFEWVADDFALIRVDQSEVHRVSPVVLGTGRAPHGITTSEMVAVGEPLLMTGQGVGLSGPPTRTRPGVLLANDPGGFRAAFIMTPGDPGAPVLDSYFRALGVLSAASGPGPFGTTVERIVVLLREAGYDLELLTGWET